MIILQNKAENAVILTYYEDDNAVMRNLTHQMLRQRRWHIPF